MIIFGVLLKLILTIFATLGNHENDAAAQARASIKRPWASKIDPKSIKKRYQKQIGKNKRFYRFVFAFGSIWPLNNDTKIDVKKHLQQLLFRNFRNLANKGTGSAFYFQEVLNPVVKLLRAPGYPKGVQA